MKLPTVSLILTLAMLRCGAAQAEPPSIEWVRQIGNSSDDFSYSIAIDAAGNAYISGSTGKLIGGNAGDGDAFLTKIDSNGNELWTQRTVVEGDDSSYSVAVDVAGNAYISGYTWGSLGGINAGNADAFLAKFDSSGNKLWTQQIGTNKTDVSNSVAVDAAGNAYISGYTWGSIGGANAGDRDAFLAKFDSSGNELWTKQVGTSATDESQSVAVDQAGNAYVSGYTKGVLGGGYAGGEDAFLTKFDGDGNELWTQQIGTSSNDLSYSVAVDDAGNAFISGFTNGSFGGANAGGSGDAFLAKFDSSGNELWTVQIATDTFESSYSVAIDSAGNAYISGVSVSNLNGVDAGTLDTFLTKLDGSGRAVWTERIGTSSEDQSRSVALDAMGNAYVGGFSDGALGNSSMGGYDAFVIKYRIVPEPTAAVLAAVAVVAGLGGRRRG